MPAGRSGGGGVAWTWWSKKSIRLGQGVEKSSVGTNQLEGKELLPVLVKNIRYLLKSLLDNKCVEYFDQQISALCVVYFDQQCQLLQ